MRGFVSKILRREARTELANETQADVNYIENKAGSILVHPNTFRALYLRLKAAYKRMRAHGGVPKLVAQRRRKPHEHTGSQPKDRVMRIQKPLMFILEHCPPQRVTNPLTGAPKRDPLTGQFEYSEHPIYASARRAAARGRGDLVQKMAAQFLPA